MGIEIELRLDGLRQMQRKAEKLGRFDKAGLMRRLGESVRQQHIRRILYEKMAPDGRAWAQLQPSTVREKGLISGFSDNILVRTYRMADGFSLRSTSTRAEVVNKTPYLIYHQSGTRKMAQRRPMGLSKANIAELQTILNGFVASLMG